MLSPPTPRKPTVLTLRQSAISRKSSRAICSRLAVSACDRTPPQNAGERDGGNEPKRERDAYYRPVATVAINGGIHYMRTTLSAFILLRRGASSAESEQLRRLSMRLPAVIRFCRRRFGCGVNYDNNIYVCVLYCANKACLPPNDPCPTA